MCTDVELWCIRRHSDYVQNPTRTGDEWISLVKFRIPAHTIRVFSGEITLNRAFLLVDPGIVETIAHARWRVHKMLAFRFVRIRARYRSKISRAKACPYCTLVRRISSQTSWHVPFRYRSLSFWIDAVLHSQTLLVIRIVLNTKSTSGHARIHDSTVICISLWCEPCCSQYRF